MVDSEDSNPDVAPVGRLVWRDYKSQGMWSHSLLFDQGGQGSYFAALYPKRRRDFDPYTAVHWEVDRTGEEGEVRTRRDAKRIVREYIKKFFEPKVPGS